MGIFEDFMNLADLGQRVAKGDVEGVARELRREDAPSGGPSPAAPNPAKCNKAPAGYVCEGVHDERGRCMRLTVLEVP